MRICRCGLAARKICLGSSIPACCYRQSLNGTDGLPPVAFWPGERTGRPHVADALTTPVVMTSTYFFKDTAHLIDFVVSDTDW